MPKLRGFIHQVEDFPISAGELVKLAEKSSTGRSVVAFYRSFPDELVFPDKEDLLARSEQVGLLNSEDQPREEFRAPEED
jgi:hypothetical protein